MQTTTFETCIRIDGRLEDTILVHSAFDSMAATADAYRQFRPHIEASIRLHGRPTEILIISRNITLAVQHGYQGNNTWTDSPME